MDRRPQVITSIEGYFDEKAAAAERAISMAKKLSRHLKSAREAARQGNVDGFGKALSEANALCSKIASEVSGSVIDAGALRTALSETFLDEVARTGAKAGLSGLRVTEGTLFAFPYLIRPPADFITALGAVKLRSVRPSVVASAVAKGRERGAFPDVKLVEAIGRVCSIMPNEAGAVGVSLFDVYELLTLLPGQRSNYSQDDFFAGVSKLAATGPHYYNGAQLEFPSPSSGARRVKTVTGTDGRSARYSAVKLLPPRGPLGI